LGRATLEQTDSLKTASGFRAKITTPAKSIATKTFDYSHWWSAKAGVGQTPARGANYVHCQHQSKKNHVLLDLIFKTRASGPASAERLANPGCLNAFFWNFASGPGAKPRGARAKGQFWFAPRTRLSFLHLTRGMGKLFCISQSDIFSFRRKKMVWEEAGSCSQTA